MLHSRISLDLNLARRKRSILSANIPRLVMFLVALREWWPSSCEPCCHLTLSSVKMSRPRATPRNIPDVFFFFLGLIPLFLQSWKLCVRLLPYLVYYLLVWEFCFILETNNDKVQHDCNLTCFHPDLCLGQPLRPLMFYFFSWQSSRLACRAQRSCPRQFELHGTSHGQRTSTHSWLVPRTPSWHVIYLYVSAFNEQNNLKLVASLLYCGKRRIAVRLKLQRISKANRTIEPADLPDVCVATPFSRA